ncbi:MAG TPA: transglutaminase-like domain-containing protein [Phycisphaerae bacterium]|nr:transglutaminase-like domain-containing protein [Phycisphaerae bacterium]
MKTRSVLCLALAWAVAVPAAADTRATYYALFLSGKKIGYEVATRAESGGKVTTTESMQITLARAGTPITIEITQTCIERANGTPLAFRATQGAGIMAAQIDGLLLPGGKMRVKTTRSGKTETVTTDYPEGALMPEKFAMLMKEKGLKEGTTYRCREFVPLTLTAMDCEVRVGPRKEVDLLGRVVPLTEIRMTGKQAGGAVRTVTYVDDRFEVQKTVAPVLGMNLEAVACTKEFALSKDDPAELLNKAILASPVPLTDAAGARSITYRLVPTGQSRLKFLASDNQSVRKREDGSFVVTVQPVRDPPRSLLPYRGTDAAGQAALAPTPYLQSDDAKVADLARQAVGDARDIATAARRIEKFVRLYIKKKDLSVGYASAAEVARSRQGDCTEHAVLTAAMCRAAGIPAQVVIGVAYAEQIGNRKNAFVPHAWNRALVGGKWIGLDAALDGFDARRIALAAGDGAPEDFFGALGTLGYFKIARVDVRK